MKHKEIWINYFKNYPETTIQDFMKLLYQSVFGGGHLIMDEEANYHRFLEEYQSLSKPSKDECFEIISERFVRVHMASLDEKYLKVFHQLFVKSTALSGTVEDLEELFHEVEQGILEAWIPFSMTSWKQAVTDYRKQGYPILRHSETFRQIYHPHYRLMDRRYVPLVPVIKKVMDLDEHAIVAIDGCSGSGKSSLASLLEEVCDVSLVHMDDFFLQPHQRHEERLNEVGGNIDYERFKKDVLTPLKKGSSFEYPIFDCHQMMISGCHSVNMKGKVVVEGSYSMHPYFKDYASLTIFLDIDPKTQKDRIEKRNGLDMAQRFAKEWIPKENAYFEQFHIKEKADLCIKMGLS